MKYYAFLFCLWSGIGLTNAGFTQCLNIHPDDLAGLRAFYKYTHGDEWTNHAGWAQIISNTPVALCDLDGIYGLEFSEGRSPRVVRIYLPNNNLTGELPNDLSALDELQILELADNSIGGIIPPSFGMLSKLRTLGLRLNDFSGSIPPELGALTALERLSLYGNQLTGSIPHELGLIGKNLYFLALDRNELTGEIPKSLGNLPALQSLLLFENQLKGSLPASLGKLQNLEHLWCYKNNLSGAIPASLGNCKSLKWLRLSKNSFAKRIPASLGRLVNLEYFNAQENELSGPIPHTFGNLTNLRTMYLGWNSLSGAIPGDLGNLANLELMHLSHNDLGGCFDLNLLNICGADVRLDDWKFDAPWSTFCAGGRGSGTCKQGLGLALSNNSAGSYLNVTHGQELFRRNTYQEVSEAKEVALYPNPAIDHLTIELPLFLGQLTTLQIKNGQGLTVMEIIDVGSQKFVEVAIGELAPGPYWMVGAGSQGMISKAFVKI